MPEFSIAHLREQGQDLIIVPMRDDFHLLTDTEKRSAMRELQRRTIAAGLRGPVGLVWMEPAGTFRFLCPRHHHGYYRSLSFDWVLSQVNRTISW